MYGKVFGQMYTGSMMGAGTHVFAVWGYAISNANSDGYVELNSKLLAVLLGTSEELVMDAIQYLTAPDPKSRTGGSDGRRMIREGQYLYRLVNLRKYMYLHSREERREYQRNWDRKNRSQRPNPTPSDTIRHHPTESEHIDIDIDINKDIEKKKKKKCKKKKKTTTTTSTCTQDTDVAMEDMVGALVESWEKVGGKNVPATGFMAVSRALSGLLSAGDARLQLTWNEVLEAVDNYGKALKIPNTQAHSHALVGFLRYEIISKYGPGAFNPDNYQADRFKKRDGPQKTVEERVADLKAKGHIP